MNDIFIDIIAGARPNFIKIAPIIDAIKIKQKLISNLKFRLIHTGQHYDKKMSDVFFSQLGIPKPDINLNVGSGTQSEQTAKIMTRYEKILEEIRKSEALIAIRNEISESGNQEIDEIVREVELLEKDNEKASDSINIFADYEEVSE